MAAFLRGTEDLCDKRERRGAGEGIGVAALRTFCVFKMFYKNAGWVTDGNTLYFKLLKMLMNVITLAVDTTSSY